MLRKLFMIAGGLLLLVLLAAGGFATFIHFGWPVRYAVEKVDLKVDATPERLARGRKLVGIRCAGCHYDQKTGTLSGVHMVDSPPEFGRIFSHNITRHPTLGLGRYTDGELAYLLRTGIRRDGVFTGPFMMSPGLADEDLESIIAFLRSDDPWVAPKATEDGQWEPTFLAKFLMHVVIQPAPWPKREIPRPEVGDRVAYGRYVATGLADCFSCHSADFKTMNALEPEKSAGYMGGGNPLRDGSGNIVPSANITTDAETGIGKWTEAEFVRALREGVRPDGRVLRYPMVTFTELSEAEAGATYAYLKTVPTIRNAVDRNFDGHPGLSASAGDGEKLYYKYACSSCHGAAGVGICDLRQASKTYDTDEKLAAFILDAGKVVPGTKMPTWSGVIAQTEFPALVAHVHKLERDFKASAAQ